MWLRGLIVSAALTALLVAVPHARQTSQPSSATVPACLAATAQGAARGAGAQAGRGAGPAGQVPAAGAARRGGGGGIPPAIPWADPPLPDGPIMLESAVVAHRSLKLVVTKGLTHPWGMAFLPDGNILITERPGCLRIVRNGVLDPKPLTGLPAISAQGLSGLMDIPLHPRFAENKFVYFTYHKTNPAPAASSGAQPGPNRSPPQLATRP